MKKLRKNKKPSYRYLITFMFLDAMERRNYRTREVFSEHPIATLSLKELKDFIVEESGSSNWVILSLVPMGQ